MYHSIVVPLDGSPFAEQALAVAVPIAETSGATVTLVRTWDPSVYRFAGELAPGFSPEAREHLAAIDYVNGVAARLRPTTGVTINVAVVAGSPVDAISQCLTTVRADLVVMTTHGLTGWSRAWIGSVADALVRVATVPVLLCRPQEAPSAARPGRFARVLIPLDGSQEGQEILHHVAAIIAGDDARLILLRVVRPVMTPARPNVYAAPVLPPDQAGTEAGVARARNELSGAAEWLRSRCRHATVEVDVRVAERAGAAIAEAAREYRLDLVALTTHARHGLRLIVGGVADKVLRGTHGSMLVRRLTTGEEKARASGRTVGSLRSGKVF